MTKLTATEALRQIANATSVEEAQALARAALGMAQRTTYAGRVRLNTPGTRHVYELGVVDATRPGGRSSVYVEANTRAQADAIARREGYETTDCNMVG